jgi:hypothetical protein
MKRIVTSLAASGLILMGAQAFADDSASQQPTMAQKQQMMKDCMAKQATDNSTLSKTDMKKACKDQMKMHSSMGSMSTTPSK